MMQYKCILTCSYHIAGLGLPAVPRTSAQPAHVVLIGGASVIRRHERQSQMCSCIVLHHFLQLGVAHA